MKKELVKFANGASYDVQNIRSTDKALDFEVQDVDKNALETILTDKDNVGIIKYMQKDTETQDETLLKAYAGYVNLSRMNTLYGVVTSVDYETQDETTESGFAEEKHNITTITMIKPSKTEVELERLKTSQSLQDGAIEEMAGMISDIAAGQTLQDGAIEDIAETVSEMTE